MHLGAREQGLGSESERWLARVRRDGGPIYLALVEALEAAIREGDLHPGDRLPPQRAVAQALGVDFTTVTRAYGAARARGLIEGTVGRGTFVRGRTSDDDVGLVDLSMNLPPPPAGLSLGELIAVTTADILARSDASALMAYHPGAGARGQRAAGATWLAPVLGEVDPDSVLVAAGAQAALAAVLAVTCGAGLGLVVEPLSYPGIKGAARQLGVALLPGAVDAEGLTPDSLERLCRETKPAAVYLTPTLQNPTAATMSEARRADIVRIARAYDLWLIEDDPYSRLADAPIPGIAALAPERTFHVATLSKCLSPGLRIAYVAAPPGAPTEQLAEALRVVALMPAPLMAAVVTRWIREGAAERLLAAVRTEARARRQLAAAALPAAQGSADSIHVWLPLPDEVSPERLRLSAQSRGLALVTAEAFATGPDHANGVRISLGGPGKRAVLDSALQTVARLLAEPNAPAGRLLV